MFEEYKHPCNNTIKIPHVSLKLNIFKQGPTFLREDYDFIFVKWAII